MLIVYSKKTGKIQGVWTGSLQSMDVLYGSEAEEYKLIWDEIEVPDDNRILDHMSDFRVNPETKQAEILPTAIQNYPIARI